MYRADGGRVGQVVGDFRQIIGVVRQMIGTSVKNETEGRLIVHVVTMEI